MTKQTSQHLSCADSSPGRARRFCTGALRTALVDDSASRDLIGDAELIVSELVTNAIDADCRGAQLTVSVDVDKVRIEVEDDAGGLPKPTRAAMADERGRGLAIVAALSTRWGFDQLGRGKRVWVELTANRTQLSPA